MASLFGEPVHGAAWKTKPTFYIVCANDETVHPELERFVAKRMNARITELQSSHVPMLSHPMAVFDVIVDAAKAVQAGQVQQQQAAPVPAE